jgi:predicted amidohydrolase YtcJ
LPPGSDILALCDAHVHMGLYASSLASVPLRGAASTAEVAARVREAAARTEAGRWIIGRGYDLNLFAPGDLPHARVLDEATTDHPVFLSSHDVHGCWVSSSALRLAHVGRGVQAPPGGIIERDPSGDPTGMMYEGAVRLVEAVLPKRTLEQIKDDLALAQADFLRRGIRFVQDLDPDTEEGWRALEDEGKLEISVATAVPQRELRRAIREGRRSGEGSPRLKLGGVKFFLDGALGSRTAAMLEPYADRPGWSGSLLMPPERLREELGLCRDAGLKPFVHAIGDRAVRVVLDSVIAIGRFPAGLEPRIEHAQTIADSDLDRFAESGAIASMQPNHLWTDIDVALPSLGERSRLLFRCGSLLRRGVKLIFGTDAPVEEPDPMLGVTLASERRRPGRDEAPFHPEEAIPRADALAAATSVAQAELGF